MGTQLDGAKVSISNSSLVSGDQLDFTPQTDITGGYNAGNGVLTLNGRASLGLYQAALRTVTYRSSSEDPTVNNTKTSRSINWEVTDVNSDAAPNGAKTSTIVSSTINITAVNDPPTADHVPALLTVI